MRNVLRIKLSIGEVMLYELQAKHIRQLVRGEIVLDLEGADVSDTVEILGFIHMLDLTNISDEQFKSLSKSELQQVLKAFLDVNDTFFSPNEQNNINNDEMDVSEEFDKWICRLINSGHVMCMEYGFGFFMTALNGLAEQRKEYIDDVSYSINKAFSIGLSEAVLDDEDTNIKAIEQLKELGIAK
ncbi:MAG: hypothetical protein HQK91_05540 [Nitrospirae bacterium]|nr:hypothetical protein [Nitrospirota bacterium]